MTEIQTPAIRLKKAKHVIVTLEYGKIFIAKRSSQRARITEVILEKINFIINLSQLNN